MNQAKALSEFLKEKRTLSGLSQKDVAEKLGYSSAQFISNWERGHSSPPIHTLRKLAELYEVNVDEMFDVILESALDQVRMDLHNKFYNRYQAESNDKSKDI
ncbi:MAG: helix-turn-helix transcriptional regulator [Bdellovibrionaceae bacterium]|nr:helix-turn-helix transcriptional regulator [Pseudobdellovibrionaceae bacterium]